MPSSMTSPMSSHLLTRPSNLWKRKRPRKAKKVSKRMPLREVTLMTTFQILVATRRQSRAKMEMIKVVMMGQVGRKVRSRNQI